MMTKEEMMDMSMEDLAKKMKEMMDMTSEDMIMKMPKEMLVGKMMDMMSMMCGEGNCKGGSCSGGAAPASCKS